MKKYEFTGETLVYRGRTLRRIKRLSDGLVGGWIEKEENLSHYGNCFIYDDAKVFDDAMVYDDAWVYDNAKVSGNAWIYGNAEVFDNAKVSGNAWVYGNAEVFDNAEVSGNVIVCDNAEVYGDAEVYGNVIVCDNAEVFDNAEVYGDAKVYGDARINKGNIIGEVQIPFKKVETYQSYNTRQVTAIKTLDDKWVFNVGCQKLIDKDTFLDRIYNTDGGLEENPHREFYLRMLKMF